MNKTMIMHFTLSLCILSPTQLSLTSHHLLTNLRDSGPPRLVTIWLQQSKKHLHAIWITRCWPRLLTYWRMIKLSVLLLDNIYIFSLLWSMMSKVWSLFLRKNKKMFTYYLVILFSSQVWVSISQFGDKRIAR